MLLTAVDAVAEQVTAVEIAVDTVDVGESPRRRRGASSSETILATALIGLQWRPTCSSQPPRP